VSDHDASTVEFDALLEEFLEQSRQGGSPSVEAYAERYPELADEIRELFPAAVALEDLKSETEPVPCSAGPYASPPERLGDFRIIREIGRGGMGVVYEAEQESLGRRVALKILLGHTVADNARTSRFEREARLAASLHHTNIVAIYGVGVEDDTRYYVMELIDGVSLDQVIAYLAAAEQSPTPSVETVSLYLRGCSQRDRWRNVARIGLSLAEALEHAHQQGVLHRDIKPANVLVDAHGGVWIADFGLAKALHADDVSQTGTTAGTLRYMAPEQFRGEANPTSDLYALGLLLYELLALKPAYPDTDRAQLMHRITHDAAPSLRESVPALPRDLNTIVHKLTAHEPQHRYPSAEALAGDLRRFLEERPIRARPVPWPVHLWRWARRKPALAAMVAALLILSVTTVAAVTVGWATSRAALAQEKEARARAEANADLALEALDRMFSRFSPNMIGSSSGASIAPGDGEDLDLPDAPVLTRGAATLLQELLPLYDRLASETGDALQVREKAAAARKRIGDVQWQLGQVGQAEVSFRKAADAYAVLAQNCQDAGYLLERARVLNRLGQLLKTMPTRDEWQGTHQEALTILASLPSTMQRSRKTRIERARTHACLGTAVSVKAPPGRGRPDRQEDNVRPPRTRDSLEHLQTAIDELRALLQEDPTDMDCLFLLALCCRERPGRNRSGRGEKQQINGRDEATEILVGLVAGHPDNPRFRFELARTYAMDGPRRRDLDSGVRPPGEERLRRSLEQMEWLVRRHPYVSQYAAGRAQLCHKLAVVYRRTGRIEEAEKHFRRAVEEMALLREADRENTTYTVWLGAYRTALADLLVRQDSIVEARQLLARTLTELDAVSERDAMRPFAEDVSRQSRRVLGKCSAPEPARENTRGK
jgi:eukaryotic-like serine/threonine-protein kinase